MSGGHYDYAYSRISDLARRIEDEMDPRLERNKTNGDCDNFHVYSKEKREWVAGAEAKSIIDSANSERKWFIGLLNLVAEAAHDIEWVDSSDYSPGDEVEAIRAIRRYACAENSE